MTPEEQLTRIENAIQASIETQARHDAQIAKNSEQIEKNTVGIRDLIVISRTLLESQKEVTGQIRESREAHDRDIAYLRELHKDTDEKLNALIAEVDRIIRRDNGHKA